jgi:type II secretory pathway pseudopilin PulG
VYAPTNPNSVERDSVPCSRPIETRLIRGITLIEVVVGLVLLSTLLTVILISTGKLHRQQKAAIQKLEAVHLLDELTAEFFRKGFPNLESNGPIENQPDRYWQVTGQPSPIAPDRLISIRLSILDASPDQPQATNLQASSDPTTSTTRRLATLEILVSRDTIGRYKK